VPKVFDELQRVLEATQVPLQQLWPPLQLPQVAPQPSDPQFLPLQLGVQPQTLAVPPPPQVCGDVQVPQVSVPPQPSLIVPQFLP
jgi:hypothetical protein